MDSVAPSGPPREMHDPSSDSSLDSARGRDASSSGSGRGADVNARSAGEPDASRRVPTPERSASPERTSPSAVDERGTPDPTRDELRISARLVLHIARQPRFAPMELAPESLTQAGMAAALGVTQASVSHALGRLVHGGILGVRPSHVRGRRQRVRIYELTDEGARLARHIRMSMEAATPVRSSSGASRA